MEANEVLQNAKEIQFTISTVLDNTLTQPWTFEDMSGGGYAASGGSAFDNVEYHSNAGVSVSNKQALNGPSHEIVSSGLTLTRELTGAFDSTSALTYGVVSLLNTRSDDQFSLRSWKDKRFEVKVGGIIHAGTDQEQRLTLDEYPVWFNGRIDDFTVNRTSIDLSLAPLPSRLQNQLPLNKVDDGTSSGAPIPYVLGSVNGLSLNPTDGLAQFHDGAVANSDAKYDQRMTELSNGDLVQLPTDFDLFPTVSLGEGLDYYHDLDISTTSVGGVDVIIDPTFMWSTNSDGSLSESLIVDVDAYVSDNLSIVADGQSFLVSSNQPNRQIYTASDFDWRVEGSGFVSDKGIRAEVILSGGVIVSLLPDPVGGRWFKISANSPGSVSISLAKVARGVRMVARSVIDGVHTLDNFSVLPSSVTPSIPSVRGQNHAITFSSVDSDTITFDYSSTSNVVSTAIWFEEIETFDEAIGDVNFELSNGNVINIDTLRENDSQSVESVSNCSPSNNSCSIINASKVPVRIGSGSIRFTPISYKQPVEIYGGSYTRNENILSISPPPAQANGDAGEYASFSSILPEFSFFTQNPQGQLISESETWNIQARMRLVSEELTSVNAVLWSPRAGFQSLTAEFDVVLVGNDWTEFSVDIKSNLPPRMFVATWRGINSELKNSATISNPDQDFIIEIDYIRAQQRQIRAGGIKFFAPEGESRSLLRTYRVGNARRYKNILPRNVALYDNRGNVAVSPTYDRIIGNVNGGETSISMIDAVRKLSVLATNEDLILTDLPNSPIVGHALTVQQPAINHIDEMLGSSDYFREIGLADDNLTISRRFDYQSYPSDFRINDVVLDSVTRAGSEQREQQFIIEYDRDYADSSLSKYVNSEFGSLSDRDTRRIRTVLKNKEDAEYIANLMPRESSDNGVYDFAVVGVGLNHGLGDAGVITDKDVPPNRAAMIKKITESTLPPKTTINTKVLLRS